MAPPLTARMEQSRRPSPPASQTSSALDEEQALLDDDDDDDDVSRASTSRRARRMSSMSNRLASVADIGGVNSFRSFARSWQRAASFAEVIPRRPSLVLTPDQRLLDDGAAGDGSQYFPYHAPGPAPPPQTSLLGQHLESATWLAVQAPAGSAGDASREPARKAVADTEAAAGALAPASVSSSGPSTIFAVPPHLATPSVIGSYGSFRSQSYGTIRARPSFSHATGWKARRADTGLDDAAGPSDDDGDAALGEEQPILVREVKQGDRILLTVEGQSTLPQSIFNSINALIGVGLLSLPLALKMTGWLIGIPLLTFMALVATHTGKLLGKCMEMDPSLITYSDLAYVAFGARARIVVSVLFTLELIGACVALIILFADSLDLLLPGLTSVHVWKCICAALVLVLNTLPLRLLSYTSVVGIFSTFAIVCIVVIGGLVKPHTPGSLWEPATTHLLPSNWLALPLAYGLFASPWGAHCVFPSIYRDMRYPKKWETGVNVSFSCSYALDTCLAIVGILMFGDGVRDMVTSNILSMPGFPEAAVVLMCVFIAIIPLTKIPLNSRPLITTADVVCGLRHDQPAAGRRSALAQGCLRAMVRVFVVAVLLLISILFPAFDSVCAFLGAALCSIISIILPISFYLKLYWKHVPMSERIVSWLLLGLFATLGLLGTVWSVLPKHLLGSY